MKHNTRTIFPIVLFVYFILLNPSEVKAQLYDIYIGGGTELVAPAKVSNNFAENFGTGYYGETQGYFNEFFGYQLGVDFIGYPTTGIFDIQIYLGGVARLPHSEIAFPYFSYGFGGTKRPDKLTFMTYGELGYFIYGLSFSLNLTYYDQQLRQILQVGYIYSLN